MKTLHIASILDRSGSMGGTEAEVIGAYNEFIREQRKLAENKGYKVKATLVLFDNQYEMVYEDTNIKNVPKLDSNVYYTRGMTALYDAVGKTIATLDGKKKVMFFIETDGAENCSTEFTQSSIKALVEKKTTDGWDFNFVGADLSKAQTQQMGASMGLAANKTMNFDKSVMGYNTRNAAFAAATTAYVDGDK